MTTRLYVGVTWGFDANGDPEPVTEDNAVGELYATDSDAIANVALAYTGHDVSRGYVLSFHPRFGTQLLYACGQFRYKDYCSWPMPAAEEEIVTEEVLRCVSLGDVSTIPITTEVKDE